MGAANFGPNAALLTMQINGRRCGASGVDADKMVSSFSRGFMIVVIATIAAGALLIIDSCGTPHVVVSSVVTSVVDRDLMEKGSAAWQKRWYARSADDPGHELEVGSQAIVGSPIQYTRVTGRISGLVYRLER